MKLPALKTYWIAWCGVVAVLVATKILASSFGWSVSHWLGLGYIAGIWFPIMILNYFEQVPLRTRIEEVRRTHAKTLPSFAWWLQLRVVFGGDTLGDREIAQLRRRHLGFMKIVLVSFFLFPVFMAVLSH